MKKRKRLLVILSTFVMAAQPMCVAAEMQDAEGFGAVEEIWADEENEEEFSAAPEWENEELNGFQAGIFAEENDRMEAEESGEIISGAIAGDSVDSGISLFSLDYYTDSYGAQLDGNAKALYDLLVQNYVVDYSQYLDSVDFPLKRIVQSLNIPHQYLERGLQSSCPCSQDASQSRCLQRRQHLMRFLPADPRSEPGHDLS